MQAFFCAKSRRGHSRESRGNEFWPFGNEVKFRSQFWPPNRRKQKPQKSRKFRPLRLFLGSANSLVSQNVLGSTTIIAISGTWLCPDTAANWVVKWSQNEHNFAWRSQICIGQEIDSRGCIYELYDKIQSYLQSKIFANRQHSHEISMMLLKMAVSGQQILKWFQISPNVTYKPIPHLRYCAATLYEWFLIEEVGAVL